MSSRLLTAWRDDNCSVPYRTDQKRRRVNGTRIARIAVFAALIAVMGITPALAVPGLSVPITAQSMAVMLTGLMLLPKDAFAAGAVFLILLLAGLPLMPGGFGGVAVLSSARGGFALGFPIAAWAVAVIATAVRRVVPRSVAWQIGGNFVAATVGGIGVLYCVAVPVGAWLGNLDVWTFARAVGVFIPGDLVKAAAASVIAASAFRAAPYLRPEVAGART